MFNIQRKLIYFMLTVLGPLSLNNYDSEEEEVFYDDLEIYCLNDNRKSMQQQYQLKQNRKSIIIPEKKWKQESKQQNTTLSIENPESLNKNLSSNNEVTNNKMPYVKTTINRLNLIDSEKDKMMEELELMKKKLKEAEDINEDVRKENYMLKNSLADFNEASIILEQDRQQLQTLLQDKYELLQENHILERQITSLQSLLEYATRHNHDFANNFSDME